MRTNPLQQPVEERPSETGEGPDSFRGCPVNLCSLQVSGPAIEHHFLGKQLIPSELPQDNIQRTFIQIKFKWKG